MSKHIELARKLKALADKGTGGEKINAEVMLNALMEKHGITIEEIEGEKIEDYFFNIEKHRQPLWHQIVKHTNYSIKCYGELPKESIDKYLLAGNWMISCTASEYIEIEAKCDFYQRLYDEETNIFYGAFLRANDLLVKNPNKEEKEMTLEEYEKWKRVNDMAGNITIGQFRKQISQPK